MSTVSQAAYELLVANFSRPTQSLITGSDSANMAPTKTRTGFLFQNIENLGFARDRISGPGGGPARSLVTNTIVGTFNPFAPNADPSGDVTVASNVFVGQSASLFVGPFELVSDRDFVVAGSTALTAANIAVAVSSLPGYTGVDAGSTVTVTGPAGQVGLRFEATYRAGELNFTFTYLQDEDVLGFTSPDSPIDPPTFLPPGAPNGVAP